MGKQISFICTKNEMQRLLAYMETRNALVVNWKGEKVDRNSHISTFYLIWPTSHLEYVTLGNGEIILNVARETDAIEISCPWHGEHGRFKDGRIWLNTARLNVDSSNFVPVPEWLTKEYNVLKRYIIKRASRKPEKAKGWIVYILPEADAEMVQYGTQDNI